MTSKRYDFSETRKPFPLVSGWVYQRQTLDLEYASWATSPRPHAMGNMHDVFYQAPDIPSGNPIGYQRHEEDARKQVDYFAGDLAARQRGERLQRAWVADRFCYINGRLAQTHEGVVYSKLMAFVHPVGEIPPGCVGVPRLESYGLGNYGLRRWIRLKDGTMQKQYADPLLWEFLKPVVLGDIRGNFWGADDDEQWYPVAPDVANAAFPGTWPVYECGHLPLPEREQWKYGEHPSQAHQLQALASPRFFEGEAVVTSKEECIS